MLNPVVQDIANTGTLQGVGNIIPKAINETVNAVTDTGNWLDRNVGSPSLTDEQGNFSPGWRFGTQQSTIRNPLPDFGRPQNVTGKLVQDVGVFITGMLGAGKITGLRGAAGAIGNSTVASAVVVDPHEERLSNLIKELPGAQQPVFEWLATNPNDEAMLGRLKNAIENGLIGAGVEGAAAVSMRMVNAVRLWRASRDGDVAAVQSLTQEGELLARAADTPQVPQGATMGALDDAATRVVPEQPPVAVRGANENRPVLDGEVPGGGPRADSVGSVTVRGANDVDPFTPREGDVVDIIPSGTNQADRGPAPNFETGKPVVADVFHGTNRSFEQHAEEALGSNTGAASARQGFFFARSQATANNYAGSIETGALAPRSIAITPQGLKVLEGFGGVGGVVDRAMREVLARRAGTWHIEQQRKALSDMLRDDANLRNQVISALQGVVDRGGTTTHGDIVKKLDDVLTSGDYRTGTLLSEDQLHNSMQAARYDLKVRIAGVLTEVLLPPISPNVRLERVRMENPYVFDFEGGRRTITYNDIIKQAKADGHDGVILRNTFDGGPQDDIFVVFSPDQVAHRRNPPAQADVVPEVGGVRMGMPEGPLSPSNDMRGPDVPTQAEVVPGTPGITQGMPEGMRPPFNDATPPPPPTSGGIPQATQPSAVMARVATEEQMRAATERSVADISAILQHGSRERASAAGHVFDDGVEFLRNARVMTVDDIERIIANTTETFTQQAQNALRGGDPVQSLASVEAAASRMATSFGGDPSSILGQLGRDAADSSSLAAKTVAYDQISHSVLRRIGQLSKEYVEGGTGGYTSRQELFENIVALRAIGADIAAKANALSSNIARALNARKLSTNALAAFDRVDNDAFIRAVAAADGNIDTVAQNLAPRGAGFQDRVASFFMSNLLWSYMTQVRNFAGNTYEQFYRPIARDLIGGAMRNDPRLAAQGALQVMYAMTSVGDAIHASVKAFRLGNSALDPNNASVLDAVGRAVGDRLIREQDGWSAATKIAAGLANRTWDVQQMPFRFLAAGDDFFKMMSAASYLKSRAVIEAMEEGLNPITQWPEFRARIARSMREGFDPDTGFIANQEALYNARLSTYTLPLEETGGMFTRSGTTVEQSVLNAVQQAPLLRVMGLTFITTPINIIKSSTRAMGLGVLVRDWRRQYDMGGEARNQVMGEMHTAAMLWAGLAKAAINGDVTGSGAHLSNQQRQQMEATGEWRRNSYVVHNEDGTKTFIPIGQLGTIGMLAGIAADLHEVALRAPATPGMDEAVGTAIKSIMSQLKDRSFFEGIAKWVDAASGEDEPDPIRRLSQLSAQTATGFVPFAAGLRAANEDPYVREARTFVDQWLGSMPWRSSGLPPRYDAFANPIERRGGLASTIDPTPIQQETARAIQVAGATPTPPSPRMTIRGQDTGVDLRDLPLSDGRNAYQVFMELVQQPGEGWRTLNESLIELIADPTYLELRDGPASQRGTRMYALNRIRNRYVMQARATMLEKYPEVREAVTKATGDRQRMRDLMGQYYTQAGEEPPDLDGPED